MPSHKLIAAIPLFLSPFLKLASAVPTVNFPINSQVPPVAQVSQAYSFTFADSTFEADSATITYTLVGPPAWLQLSSASRTFSGTPSAGDEGASTFKLLAEDGTGTTSQSVVLIVLQGARPGLGEALLPQLANFGATSSPAALLLKPLEAFSFTFSTSTFTDISTETAFYATSQDNSPLPIWLQFDASQLAFSGTCPPLVSPTASPQTYGVRLIASDVVGFAQATATFQIIVGYHVLAFSQPSEIANIAAGEQFTVASLRNSLILDGQTLQQSAIASVGSNAPDWLHLDTDAISLTGIPPTDVSSFSVTITVKDIYDDTTSTTIAFKVSNSIPPSSNGNNGTIPQGSAQLFTSKFPAANATIGQDFSYAINPDLLVNNSVTVTADLGSASAWLTYHPANLSFTGLVPQDLHLGILAISLIALYQSSTDQQNLEIDLVRSALGAATSTKSVSLSTGTTMPSSASSSRAAAINHIAPLSAHIELVIVLAVVLTLLGAALFLGCCVFCRRRRQKHRRPMDQEKSSQMTRPDAATLPESEPEGRGNTPAVDAAVREAPPVPLRSEFSWTADSLRQSKERLSKRLSRRDEGLLNISFGNGFAADLETAHPTFAKNEIVLARPPTAARGRANAGINTDRPVSTQQRSPLLPLQPNYDPRRASKRASKATSAISMVPSALPKRLSGAGHGSGARGPADFDDVRSSWQDTKSSLQVTDSRGTTVDLTAAFPTPPRGKQTASRKLAPSLRIVPTSSSESDSMADQRQKWHTDRARDQLERGARFSNAGSTRSPSAGRELLNVAHMSPSMGRASSQIGYRSSSAFSNRSPLRPSRPRRSPMRTRDRSHSRLRPGVSVASSGQWGSALSTSSSQWEDERLTEEEEDGWSPDSGRRISEELEAASARMSRLERPLAHEEVVRTNSPGTEITQLNGREVSDLQGSQQSSRGETAFI